MCLLDCYEIFIFNFLLFQIHTVYQKCDNNIPASCNCAVAVRSGDDVFVIDRCFRQTKPFNRLKGATKNLTYMIAELYLNGKLTPATRVYRKDDGMKYIVSSDKRGFLKYIISSEESGFLKYVISSEESGFLKYIISSEESGFLKYITFCQL